MDKTRPHDAVAHLGHPCHASRAPPLDSSRATRGSATVSCATFSSRPSGQLAIASGLEQSEYQRKAGRPRGRPGRFRERLSAKSPHSRSLRRIQVSSHLIAEERIKIKQSTSKAVQAGTETPWVLFQRKGADRFIVGVRTPRPRRPTPAERLHKAEQQQRSSGVLAGAADPDSTNFARVPVRVQ